MRDFNLCVWYLWHSAYDPYWVDRLGYGLALGTSRLSSYTGAIWTYGFAGSFQTSFNLEGRALDTHMVEDAARELLRQSADARQKYQDCDIPLFIFANTSEAFSFDYQSPIYGSDDMLLREVEENLILLAHEIAHTFGLPDHNSPHTRPEYDNCLMGNVYLDEVKFCSECLPKFIPENYRKTPLEYFVPPSPKQYPCPYCEQVFNSQAELDEHIRIDHGEPPPPPECNLGDMKCLGYGLYECGVDEQWHLTEQNSLECGYHPPPPPPPSPPSDSSGKYILIGSTIALGLALVFIPKKSKT